VWKREGNRALGRPRHRWEDNVTNKIYHKEIDGEGVALDRDKWRAVVNKVMNILVS
jgi:hypothetical protein